MKQHNTFYPQFRMYDTSPGASNEDKLATSTLLSYISSFKTLKSIEDDFTLPSNGSWRVLGVSPSPTILGLQLTLRVDPFGQLKIH